MRKNVKQQLALRVLSTAALMAMVSSIATAAFADTYDLNKGSVDILAEGGEQRITQWADKDKDLCVKDDNGEDIRNIKDPDIVLTTKDETTGETKTTSNTVTIDAKEGNTANVTLDNVHIEVDPNDATSGAIEIKGDGNTNLELDGDNTVLTECWVGEAHAAIEKADKYGTGTLTIKDDVNDDGTAKGTDADTTGKLLACGYEEASAIGGGGREGLCDTSNITITGGDITAIGGRNLGCGIGGGGNSITIKDHAVVEAYGTYGSAIGDGGLNTSNENLPTTITISGNATVHAETNQLGCAIGSGHRGDAGDLTINIEENANVTAIASHDVPAIGNAVCYNGSTTTINITGGTVNAINSFGSDSPSYPDDGANDSSPAIGGRIFDRDSYGDNHATCNVNINSSTGDTIVNAYIYGKGSGTAIGSVHRYHDDTYVPADDASYNADGSSNFGEINSAIVNCYNNGTAKPTKLNLPGLSVIKDNAVSGDHKYSHEITGGTLTKVVHNRKYMDENPKIDTSDLKDEDLHDWKLVGKVVEPTLEKDGYADYICSIDKCGQTKRVKLPKLTPEPSEPDTPSTPETPDTPSTPDTPEVTPADPAVTPDAPVQDSTAPADTLAADTTATAQNVAQNAEPKAAAAAPAALPQTGANWLAVVGSALSGMFLLAAGFVLDRKNRRMN